VGQGADDGNEASIVVPDAWMEGTTDQRAHDPLPPMLTAAWPSGTSGPRLRRLAPGVAVMQAADPGEANHVGRPNTHIK
jgi:hypothetical protein